MRRGEEEGEEGNGMVRREEQKERKQKWEMKESRRRDTKVDIQVYNKGRWGIGKQV